VPRTRCAFRTRDVYLSVPTKFLKSWIQSHYVDRILPTLTSEFPRDQACVDQCSFLDNGRLPPVPLAASPDLAAGAGPDSARDRTITSFAASLPMGAFRP